MAKVTSTASTAAEDTSYGSVAWTNPSNGALNDASYASVSLTAGTSSYYLKLTNFGLNIPSNATIVSIYFNLRHYGDAGYDRMRAVKNGTILSDNLITTHSTLPATASTRYFSSNDRLLNTTWTPSDLNASNFGFAVSFSATGNQSVYVDYADVVVRYYVGSGPDIKIAVGRAQSVDNTTMNITADTPIDWTPKAAMFIVTAADTDGVEHDHFIMATGFTDGTNQYSAGTLIPDTVANNTPQRWHSQTCFRVHSTTTPANVDHYGQFSSWISTGTDRGVTLSCTSVNWIKARTVIAVFFGGSDLDVATEQISMGATTSTQYYTPSSVIPDVMITACTGASSVSVNDVNAIFSLGFMNYNNNSPQLASLLFSDNGTTSSGSGTYVTSTYCSGQLFGTLTWGLIVSSIVGRTVVFNTNVSGGSDYVMALILDLCGANAKVGIYNPSTSTGSHSLSLGFQPQFVMMLPNDHSTGLESNDLSSSGTFGIGLGVDTLNSYAIQAIDEDNVPNWNTASRYDDSYIIQVHNDNRATLKWRATLDSMDTNGVNVTYGTATASTVHWPYLAIQIGGEYTVFPQQIFMGMHSASRYKKRPVYRR